MLHELAWVVILMGQHKRRDYVTASVRWRGGSRVTSHRYDVRKNFAETRLRVKGRFVKKEEEDLLKDLVGVV